MYVISIQWVHKEWSLTVFPYIVVHQNILISLSSLHSPSFSVEKRASRLGRLIFRLFFRIAFLFAPVNLLYIWTSKTKFERFSRIRDPPPTGKRVGPVYRLVKYQSVDLFHALMSLIFAVSTWSWAHFLSFD